MESNGGKKTGHAGGGGGVIRGLIRSIRRPAPAPAPQQEGEGDSALGELPPAGRRSGRGADTIAPFLEHSRNSRPGPLE